MVLKQRDSSDIEHQSLPTVRRAIRKSPMENNMSEAMLLSIALSENKMTITNKVPNIRETRIRFFFIMLWITILTSSEMTTLGLSCGRSRLYYRRAVIFKPLLAFVKLIQIHRQHCYFALPVHNFDASPKHLSVNFREVL